jgi:hypothetical protein
MFQQVSRRRRVLKAVEVVVVNLIFWVAIPYYLGVYLSKYAPSSPLAFPLFIYEFGALITVLEVGAALTQGSGKSVPFLSAGSLVSTVYIWLVLEGGNLALMTSGVSVVLGFETLLLVLLLPGIWGIFKPVLSYLVVTRAARKLSTSSA